MNRASFTYLIFIILLVSCGEKKQSEGEVLFDKVMEIHDQVMPKMGEMMNYKKQLNTKIAELREAGEQMNMAEIEALEKAVKDLDEANEAMFDWMRQFDRNLEGKVEEEVMNYLDSQKSKIEAVAVATNAALKNAEEILSK